jgi:hypothetical protein
MEHKQHSMQELQDSLTILHELLAARYKDISSLQHSQKVLTRKYLKKVRRQADKNGKLVGTIVELQSALEFKSSKLMNFRKLHAELNRKDTVIIRMGASLKDKDLEIERLKLALRERHSVVAVSQPLVCSPGHCLEESALEQDAKKEQEEDEQEENRDDSMAVPNCAPMEEEDEKEALVFPVVPASDSSVHVYIEHDSSAAAAVSVKEEEDFTAPTAVDYLANSVQDPFAGSLEGFTRSSEALVATPVAVLQVANTQTLDDFTRSINVSAASIKEQEESDSETLEALRRRRRFGASESLLTGIAIGGSADVGRAIAGLRHKIE